MFSQGGQDVKDRDLKQVSEYACDFLFLQIRQEWDEPDNHSKEYLEKEAGCLEII
jgi:hypothetical protein